MPKYKGFFSKHLVLGLLLMGIRGGCAFAVPPFPMATIGTGTEKVKAVLFISLTCSHCFEMYKTIVPKIRAEFVDSGAVTLTIMPYVRNESDLSMYARLTCSTNDFGKAIDWYISNVPWDNSKYADRIASEKGFRLIHENDCKELLALQTILLNIRRTADQSWAPSETPLLVVNGEIIQHPKTRDWSVVKALLEKHAQKK